MRKAMFAGIPKRAHYATQIFTHGHDQMQLMDRGHAKHGDHSGVETDINFAAYFQLVDVEDQIKFKKVNIIVAVFIITKTRWLSWVALLTSDSLKMRPSRSEQ